MSYPSTSRLFEKQENEDKFIESVTIAARAIARFVDTLEDGYKLIEAAVRDRKGPS